jgi:MFS family permease
VRAFRYRDYRIFWTGALLSSIGSWMMNLVLPFVLYQLTQSAVWVGASVAAQFLPMVLASPLGGSIADHYPRRLVLLATQGAMGFVAGLLWLAWILQMRDPWVLLLLVGVIGLLNGIALPSWQAFVHDLVPRDVLQSAVAMNSLQINAARAVGPALAGLVLATLGPSTAFAVNSLSFLCVVVALLLVKAGRGVRRRSADTGITAQFLAAIRYARSQPGIVMAIGLAFILGLLGNPIFTLTVVFAESVFNVGPVQLGIMNAALGVGAIAVAPLVGGSRFSHKIKNIAGFGLTIFGVALVAIALSPDYVVSVALLVVLGGCFMAVIASSNTANQIIVADPFRGRVLALRLMAFTIAAPIGGLLQGILVDEIGARSTVALSGALLICLALWLVFKGGVVRLARLDDPHDEWTTESMYRKRINSVKG